MFWNKNYAKIFVEVFANIFLKYLILSIFPVHCTTKVFASFKIIHVFRPFLFQKHIYLYIVKNLADIKGVMAWAVASAYM